MNVQILNKRKINKTSKTHNTLFMGIFLMMSLLPFNHIIPSIFPLSIIVALEVFLLLIDHKFYSNIVSFLWIINVLIIVFRTSVWDSTAIKVNIAFICGFVLYNILIGHKDCQSLLQSKFNKIYVLVIILSVILQMIIPRSPLFNKDGSDFAGITSHSYHLLLCCFLAFSYIFLVINKANIKNSLLALIIIFAVMVSGSRSNIVTIPICTLFVYLLKTRNKQLVFRILKVLLLIGFIVVIAVLIGKHYQLNTYLRILDTIERYVSGRSITNGRDVIQSMAVQDFRNNLFWGVGWQNFRIIHSIGDEMGSNAHNFYLQLFCELGVITAPIFLLPFVAEIITDIRFLYFNARSGDSRINAFAFCLSIQVYYLVSSLLHATSYDALYILMYFFSIAICSSIRLSSFNDLKHEQY